MSNLYRYRHFVASSFIAATLLTTSSTFAQSSEGGTGSFYQPVSPYPIEFGFYQHHASTAAEGYLRGKAAVIQARGSFELSASQAAILRQQARALDRENDLRQTQALLAQQKMWADARVQARNDRQAQLAAGRQIASQRAATEYRDAYRLTANDVDFLTGAIRFPAVLQAPSFESQRLQIQQLVRQQIGYGDPEGKIGGELAKVVDRCSQTLRRELRLHPRDEYQTAQKFLMGLKYSAKTLGANVAKAPTIAPRPTAERALATQ